MIRRFIYNIFIRLYRISRGIRYRFTDPGLLIASAMIASAVFGLDTRQTHAYQIFTLLFILLVLAFISAGTRRLQVTVTRKLPDFCTSGRPVTYEMVITNSSNKPVKNLTIIDELTNTIPEYEEFTDYKDESEKNMNIFDRFVGYPRMTSLIRKKRGADIRPETIECINSRDNVEKNLTFLPLRRGYLYFNRTIIAGNDPLGLARKPVQIRNKQSLLVLPKQYRMPSMSLPGSRKYQHGGINLASTIGESGDFHSLRDYRPGDPLRKIHWRTYAKRDEPVVKEFHDEYFSRTGLVLDTFLNGKDNLIFEEAVSIATSIILSYKQQESLLDLMFIKDKAYRTTAGRSLGDERKLIEILACVEPERNGQFIDLLQLVLQYSHETSSFVFVLLDWDDTRKQAVREFISRGIPVFIIYINSGKASEFNDFDCMEVRTDNFWILEAGNIQNSLDTLR